jgi:hypothetical protein
VEVCISRFQDIFGHEVNKTVKVGTSSKIYAMDGGCVFGGELRIYDSKTKKVSSVKAKKSYTGKVDLTQDEYNEGLRISREHYYNIVLPKYVLDF